MQVHGVYRGHIGCKKRFVPNVPYSRKPKSKTNTLFFFLRPTIFFRIPTKMTLKKNSALTIFF